MSIKNMHYDVKVKLNKVDSQQYRNLRIPEIDWALNEAQGIFIKMIAEPRKVKMLFDFGFEKNQRNIDDIRTIVKNNEVVYTKKENDFEYYIELPEDYQFLVHAKAVLAKNNCKDVSASCVVRQHDDEFEFSPFDRSSFEWREINLRFYDKGIKAFSDGTFIIDNLVLDYIKKPGYIHNAEDFGTAAQYKLPDGSLLTGFKDCELPSHTHPEIVDIAVLVLTGQLQYADYNIKRDKINLIN
tara:strand:- start:414 stop:1136 length:723 start_codon:yes stop_codon:yes gene_type:complete